MQPPELVRGWTTEGERVSPLSYPRPPARLGRIETRTLLWSRASPPTHTPRHPLSWPYAQAVYEGEGWLSIGFSDRGRMRGSDAVIGLPADDTVLEYDMDDYNRPVEALEQARGGSLSLILSGLDT